MECRNSDRTIECEIFPNNKSLTSEDQQKAGPTEERRDLSSVPELNDSALCRRSSMALVAARLQQTSLGGNSKRLPAIMIGRK